jgi:hypothetical protein
MWQGGELKGIIPMGSAGGIQQLTANDTKKKNNKKKHCFTLETPHRNWHFVAESEELMVSWIEALTRCRDAAKASPIATAQVFPVILLGNSPVAHWSDENPAPGCRGRARLQPIEGQRL